MKKKGKLEFKRKYHFKKVENNILCLNQNAGKLILVLRCAKTQDLNLSFILKFDWIATIVLLLDRNHRSVDWMTQVSLV